MLSTKEGRNLTRYVHDYVAYDLETTGVRTDTDQVIEIGAVKVRNGEIVGEFESFVNPRCPIPEAAARVNGISDEMVKDAPVIEQVFPDFIEFVGDDILVGHNVRYFDNRFINRYAKDQYGKVFGNDYIDTLALSRALFPARSKHNLSSMVEYYGIEQLHAHRALDDSRMTQRLYECLGKDLEEKGIDKSGLKLCPRCGEPMKKRKGRYGEFWGCSGFPGCRYTENL